jgi:hypothetical protein
MADKTETPPAELVAMDEAKPKTGIKPLPIGPDERGVFKVTKTAGEFVAGRRSPGTGKELTLTGRQAEHPHANGHVTYVKKAKDEPASNDG